MDIEKLSRIIAKTSLLTNLLRSRLALPLMYPLNSGAYASTQSNPIAESRFSQSEIVESLACITPLVVGVSKLTSLIKATHTLANYDGVLKRETYVPPTEEERLVKNRVHEIRPRINRKHRARTIVGLGAGWDRYGGGRPVDTIQDRWKN